MSTPAGSDDAAMQLVTDAAALLHANGAETSRSIARTRQFGRAFGLDASLRAGWGVSFVEFRNAAGTPVRWFSGAPRGVGMNRVSAVDAIIDGASLRAISVKGAQDALGTAARLPDTPTWLFAIACAVGALGLAVILGLRHPVTGLLIAVSAGVGAVVRRAIGHGGGNLFWQAGAAACLAGVLGACALKLGLSSSMRLAAVCPCMVLVPGPHLLNGALDIAATRISLGFARLGYAMVILLAIGVGVIAGLGLGGANLPPDPVGLGVPLWLDMVVAGIVAVCYAAFYSSPRRVLVWPFVTGMAVHGLHWVALGIWHVSAPVAAGMACLAAGFILLPISRRLHLPFTSMGFSSVVSLMPGVLVFRALSGMFALLGASGDQAVTLLVATVDDWTTAFATVFFMALGLVIPATVYGRLVDREKAQ